MMATFTPPFVLERPQTGNRLVDCWVKVPRGISVLKTNGVYSQVMYPTQDQLTAATVVYLGGHTYEISDAENADLVAAGYAAYISSGYLDTYGDVYV